MTQRVPARIEEPDHPTPPEPPAPTLSDLVALYAASRPLTKYDPDIFTALLALLPGEQNRRRQ